MNSMSRERGKGTAIPSHPALMHRSMIHALDLAHVCMGMACSISLLARLENRSNGMAHTCRVLKQRKRRDCSRTHWLQRGDGSKRRPGVVDSFRF
jgi:hypothetical protein